MDYEDSVFDNKCNKVWYRDDWAYYCHDCSLTEFIVICFECYEHSKHFKHKVETIYCEKGVWCDCGNERNMRTDGFCSKHSIENGKQYNNNKHRSSLRSRSKSFTKSRKISHNKSRESESFLDGILHLFSTKSADLPEFYDLNKVSKYSLDGILVMKYFDKSKALKTDIKIKRIYEITKLSTEYTKPHFQNKRRMLLWYTITNKETNCLSKVLTHGIMYENGKIGRGLYFRDRINRSFKYDDKDFGLLLLCEVAVGSMYRISEQKQFREVPYGFDSVKAVGRYTPEKDKFKTIGNNILVPTGKTTTNQSVTKTDFEFNQYIVFDKNQVIIRYLVQYNIQK